MRPTADLQRPSQEEFKITEDYTAGNWWCLNRTGELWTLEKQIFPWLSIKHSVMKRKLSCSATTHTRQCPPGHTQGKETPQELLKDSSASTQGQVHPAQTQCLAQHLLCPCSCWCLNKALDWRVAPSLLLSHECLKTQLWSKVPWYTRSSHTRQLSAHNSTVKE